MPGAWCDATSALVFAVVPITHTFTEFNATSFIALPKTLNSLAFSFS
jgi:hypothetical protein